MIVQRDRDHVTVMGANKVLVIQEITLGGSHNMETVTLKSIIDQTGLSRQCIYNQAKKGELTRVGKNKYTKESANAFIAKKLNQKKTIARTKTGVTKDKLNLLTELGILQPDEHGRYTQEDVMLAKNMHISHRKDGKTVLTIKKATQKTEEPKDQTLSLKDMEAESGIKKPTLLHYVRSGKIAKVGNNEYSKNSFDKFLADYKDLQENSMVKADVMKELGINEEKYNELLHAHKLEKASFERYTKKSVGILKGMPKRSWMKKAPTYEGIPITKAYTGRDLPDDEVLTYQQVKEMLNREKSTIVHLVKEGKIELVGRNRYTKDSVEKYLEQRDGKKEEEKEPEYYTAKQVKSMIGIGKGTHLSYYVKKGFITKEQKNGYTKESVDKYVASKRNGNQK